MSEQIHATRSSDEYLSNRTNTIFNFTEVNEECIDSIIKKMKSKSSTGYDNISNKLIKSARDVLIKPLTFVLHLIMPTEKYLVYQSGVVLVRCMRTTIYVTLKQL